MSADKKNEGVIYRCPACLGTLNDVTIFEEDGLFNLGRVLMSCGLIPYCDWILR